MWTKRTKNDIRRHYQIEEQGDQKKCQKSILKKQYEKQMDSSGKVRLYVSEIPQKEKKNMLTICNSQVHEGHLPNWLYGLIQSKLPHDSQEWHMK